MHSVPDRLPKCRKPPDMKQLLNEALHILYKLGIPMDQTPRRLEKMALVFLSTCDVKSSGEWASAKSFDDSHMLTTREIIAYVNRHFEESISDASYDDIRRNDLSLPVTAGIVMNSAANPNAARNSPSRRYALSPIFAGAIRRFGPDWDTIADSFMISRPKLVDQLSPARSIELIPLQLPTGQSYELSPGKHNQLQVAIVSAFLPRFAGGAELLYIGDAANKYLHRDEAKLKELGVFDIADGDLPDIIAFNRARNWLFLIEAVHSSGPVSRLRMHELRQQLKNCNASPIFVTAFTDRTTFRRFIVDIAWETEVWIAEEPDHLIHFNGGKFLGPHST